MSSTHRRFRPTPSGVIATIALVFAMSGGAYAAKKYLITSTKQISPSVLKSLKGAAGKNGAIGAPVTRWRRHRRSSWSCRFRRHCGSGWQRRPGRQRRPAGKEGKAGKEGEEGALDRGWNPARRLHRDRHLGDGYARRRNAGKRRGEPVRTVKKQRSKRLLGLHDFRSRLRSQLNMCTSSKGEEIPTGCTGKVVEKTGHCPESRPTIYYMHLRRRNWRGR